MPDRLVVVTPAQRYAAQVTVKWDAARGRQTPPEVIKIANAKRASDSDPRLVVRVSSATADESQG
jgi:hypothetical protein